MQRYESIRHETDSYIDESGQVVLITKYYIRLAGETEERRWTYFRLADK